MSNTSETQLEGSPDFQGEIGGVDNRRADSATNPELFQLIEGVMPWEDAHRRVLGKRPIEKLSGAINDNTPVITIHSIPGDHILYQTREGLVMDRGFQPTDIATLQLWLDASQTTGYNNGDPVSSIPDLSGLGQNATQVGATRPTYLTNAINQRPAFQFNGSQHIGANFASLFDGDQLTLFIVWAMDVGTMNFSRGFSMGLAPAGVDFGPGGFIALQIPTNLVAHFRDFADFGHFVYVAGAMFIQTVRWSTSLGENQINGGAISPNVATPGLFASNRYRLGVNAGDFNDGKLTGKVAEVILYKRTLTDLERDKVNHYLKRKYHL